MIFQNLIYGLFISGIKDQFFFLRSLSWALKKKGGQVHGDGVQICIIGGSKQFFLKNILYIYIYIYIKFWVRGFI